MDRKKFLSVLDYASFVSLILATILVVVFEFTGTLNVLKASIYVYDACALMLIVFAVSKIVFVYKKEEVKDEIFVLTKSQKVWLFVRMILSCLLFGLITTILACI